MEPSNLRKKNELLYVKKELSNVAKELSHVTKIKQMRCWYCLI